MKNRGQMYCPICGSSLLKWASGLPQLWSIYECRECGYRGSLVVEDGELAKRIRKRWLGERVGDREQKESPHSSRGSGPIPSAR